MCFVCGVLQIVHRYDVILIQEVRDSDLSATQKLMDRVNELDTTVNKNIQYYYAHLYSCRKLKNTHYDFRQFINLSVCLFS